MLVSASVGLNWKFIKFCRVKYFSIRKMSTYKCNVAVCQFTSTDNKENNLKIVKELIAEAVQKNAKVVFLPEACDFIASNKEMTKALAEPLTGTLMNEYRNLAKSHNIWLSVGGFHELILTENNEQKFFNSHVLIDNRGDIQGVYKKMHLFDVVIPEKNIYLKESDLVQSGCQVLPPVETPAGPLSLSICYDLRFPELSILQRKQGASILTYPSAFTYATGLLHWEVLLRARAIENQCYVVAAAQYGKHNEKRTSFGQALIINPRGEILAQCPKYREGHETDQSVALAEIDSELIQKVRTEMPVFQHRRDDVYQLQLLVDSDKFVINDTDSFMFADKNIPASTVFYKTKYSFAFTNIRCVVPGHVLISSIRPAKRLENLTEEEVADLFKTAVTVQKVLEKVHGSTSTTVCVQDGKHAGQTIPHVHVHVLPRQPNDFPRNDDIYNKLAQHDRVNNPEPLRSIAEMSAEAKLLRNYFS